MKKISVFLCILAVFFTFSSAQAVVIDFESVAVGNYASLTIDDVTFTTDALYLQIRNESPGDPISGHNLVQYSAAANYATFAVNVYDILLGVGDYNADVDNTYMEAYDASDNLLASDYYQNPGPTFGGDYLSVSSATAIAYVKFWDARPYPGAVYWDNLTYETSSAVPEPASMLMLCTGLIGLLAGSRKKILKK